MIELEDKVAIVTGASSGIGASIAHALSNHGVKVVLSGRNESRLNAVAKRIQEEVQTEVDTLTVDVTQKSDLERLVRHTQEKFGRVDILVNSAGKMLSSAITDDDVDAWDTMLDVNVKGTLYGIHAVLPEFLNQSSGHIINISSISGFEVTKKSTLYSATKAAIHSITQGLEKELAKTGVRATSISPGMVDTPLSGDTDWGERKKLDPNDIAEAVLYALQQPSHVNVNEITVRPV
ncbi:SDR family oxidoreductase [Staphylococcus succinus]|jgi:NADP-dependent 3-hydroxy acid dehydrogenase YdfG|uniref:SDR family NAD(P)-dependent oxidoreductase n=2 Tax=Staphylococcus succinus TaxID=61015 RepID=A0A9Q6HMW2_9STAP|nr:SDR family oxidoreductase [Staphylococcus succinus]MEB8127237.1 SDR family oxidoreductase [Staphylococcus succinus]MEB8210077.1 SDR family oxidoreductase [Staphylococcus succinus]PTI42992.1 SDR family NAD(P)-dependent oxidoreductase [Staphylococcus succinus]PTI75047.1 SDR family NAD(P)-dependent oxidoreductase [Staphylococcus succinus]PTJ21051.1 SDR family NAD(P)-dependent oxidoreductase [Staphylococcus succinus]